MKNKNIGSFKIYVLPFFLGKNVILVLCVTSLVRRRNLTTAR